MIPPCPQQQHRQITTAKWVSASGYIQELHKSITPAGSSEKSLTIHKSAETRGRAVTRSQCALPRPGVAEGLMKKSLGPRTAAMLLATREAIRAAESQEYSA